MDEKIIKEWAASEKSIYTNTYEHAHDYLNSKKRISDLVAGSIVGLLGFEGEYYKVQSPDGLQALVSKAEAQEYQLWLSMLNPDAGALIETAKTLMGYAIYGEKP